MDESCYLYFPHLTLQFLTNYTTIVSSAECACCPSLVVIFTFDVLIRSETPISDFV